MDASPSDNLSPQQLEFKALVERLMDQALKAPADALPAIDKFASALATTAEPDLPPGAAKSHIWPPALLYFLAYGRMAEILNADESARTSMLGDLLQLCEKSLANYRIAVEAATYSDTEQYNETVVVRPASLFRKAVTTLELRTRQVTRTEFDMSIFDPALDTVVGILEANAPDRSYELLGSIKFKHLAERAYMAPVVKQAIEDGTISQADLRAIGELRLRSERGVIRSVFISWGSGGPEPSLLLAYMENPNPIGADSPGVLGTGVLRKKGGQWTLT